MKNKIIVYNSSYFFNLINLLIEISVLVSIRFRTIPKFDIVNIFGIVHYLIFFLFLFLILKWNLIEFSLRP